MSNPKYDVIIVGAGPAGIFAALELSEQLDLRVAIFDKGNAIDKRRCPAREGKGCVHCQPCSIMTGWGGAGAFSDGKLTLSPASGGHLGDLLGEEQTQELIDEVDRIYVSYGADRPVYGGHTDEFELLEKRSAMAGLRLVSVPIRHIGTERCSEIMTRMHDELVRRGVQVSTRTQVARVLVDGGAVAGVETEDGQVIEAKRVIIAPGREGAGWLKSVAAELGLSLTCNPVDIGVRVELPATVVEPVTDLLYEFKFLYYSKTFDDLVRTFCLPGDQPFYCQQEDGQITLKAISDYKPGESVLTFDFTTRAFAFVKPQAFTRRHYSGQIYRIQVVGNGVIETTADHLFFVAHKDEYTLKHADELSEGDLIPVARDFESPRMDGIVLNLLEEFQALPSAYLDSLYVRNTDRLVRALAAKHQVPMQEITQRKRLVSEKMTFTRMVEVYRQYDLTVEDIDDLELGYVGSRTALPAALPLSPALTRLLGFFIAEGNYNIRPEQARWLVAFTATDDDIRQSILDDFRRVFRHSTYHLVNTDDKHRGAQIFFSNKLACALFKYVFAIGEGAANKCLPKGAFNWPKKEATALLEGLFSGDGTISVDGTVAYSTVSSRLAQEMVYLLQSQGIPTRYKVTSKQSGAHFGPYQAKHDLWQVRVRGLKATQKLLRKLKLVKEDHRLRAEDIMKRDSSYSRMVQVPNRIARLEQKQVLHLPIREITTRDFEGEVYDFVAPSTQNFVAGQLPFVVHNCVCPYGEVALEYAGGVMTVNGHSYADRKTYYTNFALLVSKNFTEPFDDPVTYGQSIARLANLLSGGVLVQRLGDLESGRRSTPERLRRSIVAPTLRSATPGDLGLVLPHRHLVNVLEMMHALDEVMPGVCSRHTLLYGVEAKFYSNRLKLTEQLETEVEGLYACGDGAGITRGLVQASASGLLAARAILNER